MSDDPRPAAGDESATANADTRFRLLVDTVRDHAIFLIDADGWVSTWNAGAEQLTGYAAEEIVGRHVSIFATTEDQAAGRSASELHAARLTGTVQHEGWRVRKDGSRFWAEVTVCVVPGSDGERDGFAIITRDATQRRQLEETLRRSETRLSGIIASAMDAIISVNAEQRVVVFNTAAERMFGCPAHQALGKPLDRFIPERFRAAHTRHIEAFGDTGVTSRSMGALRPLTALRADGREFPIEASISQVDAGKQRFFTVILRDITERVEQEDALRRQAAALEEANRALARLAQEAQDANKAKADFLAMMSHELRTPLNAIAGYVQLLELGIRGPVTQEQAGDLQRIQRSQRHLLSLINSLLSFARIEAGQIEYVLAPVPLPPILSELAELLLPQAREKAIRLTSSPVADSLVVWADRDKLQQILLNLLGNAVKFTPEGGAVRLEAEAAPDAVLVRVTDTGSGIPEERLGHIFEPFVQLDRSLTRPGEGVGLGLAISRDLARGMGGELTALSTVGEGATFTLRLPRAP